VEPQPRNKSRVLFKLFVSLLLFAFASWIFLNRQSVIDQVAVWQFRPSAEVAALSERTHMTDTGQFYFYASHPDIQDRTEFNNSCKNLSTQETVVLGCYSARRIYLFNVNDPNLDGIKEVTAAHEMLHAAYDRLEPNERKHIDALLDNVAKNVTDTGLQDLLKEYDKTEPGERLNELHSILGTQTANVGSELETYYKRYFSDRQQVVALAQKYESVFKNLKTQQDQLAKELEQLAGELTAESGSYNESIVQLNADIDRFNNQASTGGFGSQAEFNAQRSDLVARQEQLRVSQEQLNQKIALYNQKRAQLEATNSQAAELNRSINSNLSPVPTL
jgi:hypothetical protein